MAIEILALLHNELIATRLMSAFNSRVIRHEDACWEWIGPTRKGYGQVSLNGNTKISAHRLSFAMHYQEDPCDFLVCHSCDNPECSNPDHLWLGGDKLNALDMICKGRQAKQSMQQNHSAELTAEQVSLAFSLIEEGWTNKAIAELLGVHDATISCIRRGITWKDHPDRRSCEGVFKRGTKKARIDAEREERRVRATNLVTKLGKEPTPKTVESAIRGEAIRGERNKSSKLTESQVIEVFLSSESSYKAAKKYGTTPVAIQQIRRRDTWGHVTADLSRP